MLSLIFLTLLGVDGVSSLVFIVLSVVELSFNLILVKLDELFNLVNTLVVFYLYPYPVISPINVIGISFNKNNVSTAAHVPLLYNNAGYGQQ